MGLNKEIFIKDRQELLDTQDSYESKLWYFLYQEEKHKNQILKTKLTKLTKKTEN